ncbi:DNA/RNA helicase, superfamily II, SNF2 family [Bernardetia litoralis DSM 6794]|uniref:DNA/RNA helicase, superfamily II, SNF2 family n=1 Tax=Bernardetia litoralis (strain ATCC 23117 / DSM 6794 / NBRC 15988 / NCIMB 1366 / Fx l1 / Sio-4) TaxID=880071 RepID=I4AKV4_BERLS|nr:DEAD/DEAH box helicase [Bernardetia litoralis]AFM04589.1 DNA/RNA helicase, superfamily II, SNF2 family [Bernardetia litoralis DSM 6794]
MNVSPNESFKVVYSLYEHQFLGCLFESFVVQVKHGKLTLKYQNISSRNAHEFDKGLSESDYELIELMDSIQQDVIIKKFTPVSSKVAKTTRSNKTGKKLTIFDFVDKIYDKEKGDKVTQKLIEDYIEDKKIKILNLLLEKNKLVYTMQKDGTPTGEFIEIPKMATSIHFHVYKNPENTQYYPTIRHEGKTIDFRQSDAKIVCNSPAWLLHKNILYHFDRQLEGAKLKPFLRKKFILVNKSVEETYYKKFVASLISSYTVIAVGFDIVVEKHEPQTELHFKIISSSISSLFNTSVSSKTPQNENESTVVFELNFRYKDDIYKVSELNEQQNAHVIFENRNDKFIFTKFTRQIMLEKAVISKLKELGLELQKGKLTLPRGKAFSWIAANESTLQELGIELKQYQNEEGKNYFIGKSQISISIDENKDWFDINAKIFFGEYEIPFMQIRQYILKGQKEFTLPNGEIAVIPDEWFTEYSELFEFMQAKDDKFALKKYHLAIVQNLEQGNFANVTMDRKLQKLYNSDDFGEIDDFSLPKDFKGQLRPYQKAGYNWLRFLQEYNFGGCLADDMGLGKTVQTLALLQSQKEKEGEVAPSLLIMPTSLLYNWAVEAKKFAPNLKVWRYTGTDRNKDITTYFSKYDVILTSYGTMRIDVDILNQFYFNYVILDESQAIKNPTSAISKAVKTLKSRFKLILTGTPIENSTLDLWSQMSFVNGGLLGNQKFFKTHYQIPIEKQSDVDKARKLQTIIKPFILRRTKKQVATDLPPKVENIIYVEMSKSQEKVYEEAKSYYRNEILKHIEIKGMGKSQIMLLQGLTRLRQLANHPKMVDSDYEGDSGKFSDLTEKLKSVLSEGHKVLIFSQFVRHLTLVRNELDKDKINYSYLDGGTKDRKAEVENFQTNKDIKVFLLSLKAGGVGLNLTAADYVFMLDPWWNPAVEAQAVDRAHRIGQENKVFIYKFITQNSVEEKILALQQQKIALSQDLITTESSFVKTLSKDDIADILK